MSTGFNQRERESIGMSAITENETRAEVQQSSGPEREELETFGIAGPILIFMFILWGVTMAAAATAVS